MRKRYVLIALLVALPSTFTLLPLTALAGFPLPLIMGGQVVSLRPCTSPLGLLITVNSPIYKSVPLLRSYMVLIPGTFFYPFGKISLNLHVMGLLVSQVPTVCTVSGVPIGAGPPLLFVGTSR